MRRLRFGMLALAVAAFALALAGTVGADDEPKPDFGMAGKRSSSVDVAGFDKQHGPHFDFECVATSGGSNTNLDCDDPFPNNEPNMVVDPANPNHAVASSNDYGSCCDQYYTTLNGGSTWSTGNMSIEKPQKIGSDPVTVFDRKHGTTLHTSLSFAVQPGVGSKGGCDGDVVVSPSRDGGLTWGKVVIVHDGVGCDLSKNELFDDKEWITADNNPASPFYGRVYLTWTGFEFASGAYLRSPILESHSSDGGFTWSTAKEISGSNAALCTFQETGPAAQCDESQASVGTVGPDGTVYVAFMNEQNQALWEPGEQFDDQYLVVKSTDGGATWSSPTFAAGLEDGSRDYPLNVDDRQTLTGYQVRVWGAGNIVASPTQNGRLFLAFSDNRNGVHDSDSPVTNSDVFVVTSTNGGATWTAPAQVDSGAGDQWFPWIDVDPTNGSIGVLYHDRGASNGPLYNTALAEGTLGSLVKTTLSTAPSNPTNSIFFQAGVPGCEKCATFHGDYIGLSYSSTGVAYAAWTDMREFRAADDGFAQSIVFAKK
jgi:hypothetical protein